MAPWNRLPPAIALLLCLFATGSQARRVKRTPPPLFTGNFGDCLAGQSQLDVEKFDVAYDAGNRTLVLHLEGASAVEEESLMLHLSIDAYGTNRFDMTFDTCSFNISSLCPLRPGAPISAHAVLPVGAQSIGDLSGLPFNIPDFDGAARLQIYASSAEAAIGCFQAAMTNGKTLSHVEIIAPVLGGFTLVAMLASFLTAAYGVSIPHMRMHHAHSLPVLVVFETFQSIFFSGALSVRWPPLLVAWWSNFAWSAGFIYIGGLIKPINSFTGVTGSQSQVDGPATQLLARSPVGRALDAVGEQTVFNSSFLQDYAWSGKPVATALPLPGTWSGFPSVLSTVKVPLADGFVVGLIWLAIAIGLVALAITGFKILLEGLVSARKIKEDRMAYFRSHWVGYLGHAIVRTLMASFFATLVMAMLQFSLRETVGPVVVATVVLILAVLGIGSLIASGCRARTREGRFELKAERLVFYRTKVWGKLPGVASAWETELKEHGVDVQRVASVCVFRIRHVNNNPERPSAHLDEPFVQRFGWLTARYRRTRWWFLAYHIPYLFCRGAFLGGGWQRSRVQVYGVLAVDVLNFVIAALLSPYEGTRNTVMGVWVLGICKITTTSISIALLPEFNHGPSHAAGLGIAIVVIQALTVMALLVLIVLGTVSSWISLMRNRQEMDPDWLEPVRVNYFTGMERQARDARFDNETEPPPPTPRFSMVSIRRRPKIEDEDEGGAMYEPAQAMDETSAEDQPSMRGVDRHSQAGSAGPRLSTGSLPRAARPYRASGS